MDDPLDFSQMSKTKGKVEEEEEEMEEENRELSRLQGKISAKSEQCY